MAFRNFISLCLFSLASSPSEAQLEKRVIMGIFAHPDDEAVTNVSPLLAKYAGEGHIVYLVIATKGELGIAKHANIPAGDSLALTRAQEITNACKKLGILPPILLGLGDGSLAKDFTGEPARIKLDSVIKLYKPDIIITWGPDGGYGHMDHRLVSDIVTEIFQSGIYSKPQQLYFTAIPTEHWMQRPEFKTRIKRMSDLWKPVKKDYLPIRIKCSNENVAAALASMQCYNSQFSNEEMLDLATWMRNAGRDTVYLRPFAPLDKIRYSLLNK